MKQIIKLVNFSDMWLIMLHTGLSWRVRMVRERQQEWVVRAGLESGGLGPELEILSPCVFICKTLIQSRWHESHKERSSN